MASLSCRSRQTVIAVLTEIGRSVVRAGVRLVLDAGGTVVGRRHMVRVAERTHQPVDVLPDHHHVGITAFLIRGLGPLKDAVGRGRDWLPLTPKLIAPRRPEAA